MCNHDDLNDLRVAAQSVATALPMCSAALAYASRGWEVFPAPPGKKKSYKSKKFNGGINWGKTTNPKIIQQNFSNPKFRDANVGIATGIDSGIFVIEADTVEGHGVDGLASISELEAKHGPLPETLMAISPSGSLHRYYQHPGPDIKIKNSASEIAPGVDIRGDGGMVIAPPSVKPEKGEYKWLNNKPVVEAPVWLLGLIFKTNEKAKTQHVPSISERAQATIRQPSANTSKYADAALNGECDAVANAARGQRNSRLNRSAFNLGTLVGAGALAEGDVISALLDAASANGLVHEDGKSACQATIASGLGAGIKQSRTIPEPKAYRQHDMEWLRQMVARRQADAQ